jgi:hypothetical protein
MPTQRVLLRVWVLWNDQGLLWQQNDRFSQLHWFKCFEAYHRILRKLGHWPQMRQDVPGVYVHVFFKKLSIGLELC